MTSDSERPEPPDDAERDPDAVDEDVDGASVEALGDAASADETTVLPAASAGAPPSEESRRGLTSGGWREWLRVRVTNPPRQPPIGEPPSGVGPPPGPETQTIPRAGGEGSEAMDTSTLPILDSRQEERHTGRIRSLRFWEAQAGSAAEPTSETRPNWEWSAEDAVAGDQIRSTPRLPVRPELATGAPARFGTLAELRSERRELRRQISERQFDLGGLHVEMARQARIDHPLLQARALELVAANDRLTIVERAIEARRRGDDPAWASLLPCSACGAPRPQDASFCPYCGTPVAPARVRRTA